MILKSEEEFNFTLWEYFNPDVTVSQIPNRKIHHNFNYIVGWEISKYKKYFSAYFVAHNNMLNEVLLLSASV